MSLPHCRPQLKLSRDFGADELERVLVSSAGDGGLLADVHIVSWRGQAGGGAPRTGSKEGANLKSFVRSSSLRLTHLLITISAVGLHPC